MVTRYKLVAGMATMPSRSHTAPLALQSLAGQFDTLHLVLNGYREVPEWAKLPGVKPILSLEGTDHGAAGKLLGITRENIDGELIYFCVDDDIRYPKNFASRLVSFLGTRDRAMVGVHGSVIRQPFRSWRDDRKKYSVNRTVLRPKKVDVVATCGCAFYPNDFDYRFIDWPDEYRNCVDLFLANLSARQGIEHWIIPRYGRWLRALEVIQEESIYAGLIRDDSKHVALALDLLELKRKVTV